MIHWDLFARFGPRMIDGFFVTLELGVGSVLLGFVFAVPLAFGRVYGPRPVRSGILTYTYLLRGTPVLAQLYFLYNGSAQFQESLAAMGLWWLFRDPFFCSLFTFALNTAAYQTEIFAGALRNVPSSHVEAARAVAMSPATVARRVLVPLAARLALRPFGNETILMIKASALASVVTVYDLLATSKLAFQRTYDFQAYLAAALVYIATVEIVRLTVDALDARLSRHMTWR